MSPKDRMALAMELAPLVAKAVVAQLSLTSASSAPAAAPTIKQRLTVEQFAFCLDRSQEFVRRKIRGKTIPAELVSGPPYFLHPKALKLLGVTNDIAAARLQEWFTLHPEPAEPQAQNPSSALQPSEA